MASESNAVTADLTRYTPRFAALLNAPIDHKIRLSRELARKLNRHAGRLEGREAALRADSEAMATNYLHRIEYFPPEADFAELRPTIARLLASTTESRASLTGYRTSLISARQQNVERDLNEAYDRLISAVTNVVSDFDRTVRFTTEALAAIDAKIASRQVDEKESDQPSTSAAISSQDQT
jgi:phage shock protein A